MDKEVDMINGIRRSVDKRTCTAFVPEPPEPVFCTENELPDALGQIRHVPRPRKHLLASGWHLSADRYGENREEAEE